jgi:hypothetical protein
VKPRLIEGNATAIQNQLRLAARELSRALAATVEDPTRGAGRDRSALARTCSPSTWWPATQRPSGRHARRHRDEQLPARSVRRGGRRAHRRRCELPGRPLTPETLGFLQRVATVYGRPLGVTTGTNHSRYIVDGLISDHADGHAADLGMTANGGSDDSPAGRTEEPAWPREMRHVPAPRPGALAAIDAERDADGVVMGYVGFPCSFGDLWRQLARR